MFGKIFFFLCAFGLIFGNEMENIERDDVKDEAKEKHLEEATMLIEKPAEIKIYVSMYDWLFSTNSSPSAEAKETTRVDQEFSPRRTCKSYCCPSGYYMHVPRCYPNSKQAMNNTGKLSENIPEIEAHLLNEDSTYQGEEELIAAEPTPEEKQTARVDQEFSPRRTCYVSYCCPSGYYMAPKCYSNSKQAMDFTGKLSETIPEIEAQLLNEGWTYQGEEELIAAEPTPEEKQLENIKQGDVKDEAKEKHLEEVPQYKTTEATMLLEISAEAKGSVNCGNHRASSCTRCPQGNGRLWCNGECKWYGVWGCGPNRLRNEKPAESKNYSLYDWLFSTNSSPSAEAKELENIKQGDVKDEAKEKHLEEVPQYKTTEATMLLELSAEAKGSVNCGNHRASSCIRCPQGNGRHWCNGECKWTIHFGYGYCLAKSKK